MNFPIRQGMINFVPVLGNSPTFKNTTRKIELWLKEKRQRIF